MSELSPTFAQELTTWYWQQTRSVATAVSMIQGPELQGPQHVQGKHYVDRDRLVDRKDILGCPPEDFGS
ncbi:hypothetical protein TNCV_4187311 [Trichonephila clavipes]|nr:hypothetical protein TNCV_4187311 [Trichonephila clavipes]